LGPYFECKTPTLTNTHAHTDECTHLHTHTHTRAHTYLHKHLHPRIHSAARQGQLYRSTVWRFSMPAQPLHAPPNSSGGSSSSTGRAPHLPYHKFRAGDTVLLSRFSAADEHEGVASRWGLLCVCVCACVCAGCCMCVLVCVLLLSRFGTAGEQKGGVGQNFDAEFWCGYACKLVMSFLYFLWLGTPVCCPTTPDKHQSFGQNNLAM
jgi:hypothetical protein